MKPIVLSFSTSRYGEPSTFGEYTRKARLEKGLRQKDLADMVGIREDTITNWEKASILPRDFRKVKKACAILAMNFEETVDRFCPQVKGYKQHFGKQLLRARILKKMTQEEVARKAGIDPTTLGRWEKSNNLPTEWTSEKLDSLYRVLDVSDS